MNLRTLVFCSLVVCPAVLVQAQGIKIEISGTAGLATVAKGLAADLKEARELLGKVSDKPTRERLELLISRSELKVLELEKMLSGVSVAGTTPAVTPISAENFAKLLKGIKAESFDDGKASFVATFATNGRLTCDQARELLKTFSFDDGRVNSAVALYPRLTDPENFFTVLDVFAFDSSRSSVREKLKLNKK